MLNLVLDEAIDYLNGELASGHPELRPAHLRLFRAGAIEGMRVTELAARVGMTKQAMHELVVRLESLGYLRREVDPDDVRARRITLTEPGRTLEAEVVAASARLHLRWRETLGDELFSALWTALDKLTGRDEQSRKDYRASADLALGVDT
jgi:DNA-binding MarR family transcriptional regulator